MIADSLEGLMRALRPRRSPQRRALETERFGVPADSLEAWRAELAATEARHQGARWAGLAPKRRLTLGERRASLAGTTSPADHTHPTHDRRPAMNANPVQDIINILPPTTSRAYDQIGADLADRDSTPNTRGERWNAARAALWTAARAAGDLDGLRAAGCDAARAVRAIDPSMDGIIVKAIAAAAEAAAFPQHVDGEDARRALAKPVAILRAVRA